MGGSGGRSTTARRQSLSRPGQRCPRDFGTERFPRSDRQPPPCIRRQTEDSRLTGCCSLSHTRTRVLHEPKDDGGRDHGAGVSTRAEACQLQCHRTKIWRDVNRRVGNPVRETHGEGREAGSRCAPEEPLRRDKDPDSERGRAQCPEETDGPPAMLDVWEDRALGETMPPEAAGKLDTPCTGSRVQEGRELMTHTENLRKELTVSVVTPTGGFRVDGTVHGITASFLVDTGSAVTLIRKDIWEKMQVSKKGPLQPWSEHPLVGVDGTPLDVYGHITADLTIEGHPYSMDMVVVSPLTTEAILGLDFMKKNEVSLDLGKGKLIVGNRSPVPICQKSRPTQINSVQTSEMVKLPPFSKQVVIANICGGTLVGSCIVEKLQGGTTPCVVARALVEPQDGKVPICLLNPKSEPTVIPANTVIATIEEANQPSNEPVANVFAQPLTQDKEALLWTIVESSGTELTQSQKEQFFTLLSRYDNVFATNSTDLG